MNNPRFGGKKILAIIIGIVIVSSTITTLLVVFLPSNDKDDVLFVSGELTENTTWSGLVHVTGSLFIPVNITLTIQPGTTIEFEHFRG